MSRHLLLVLLITLSTVRAAAHGAPPAALAVLSADERGPTVVRLAQGLAYRTDDGFRFVCPEAWGGDVSAPAASLPDGTTVIAGEPLTLLEPDGTLTAHPRGLGGCSALARADAALFGLFPQGEGVQLWRITRGGGELVYSFDEPFSALAVRDDKISLLRFSDRTLLLQDVSPEGELGARQTWFAPNRIADAALRSAAEQLYVVVWGSAAPWVTLERVTPAGSELVRDGNTDFAGPLALASATLIARDGVLEPLESSDSLASGNDDVTCLGSVAGNAYACVGEGLKRVAAEGLGEPLFEFASLREPDYQHLPESQRADCATRWRDLSDHLIAAGLRSAEAADAAMEDALPTESSEPGARERGGCALGAGSSPAAAWGALSLLLAFWARRSRSLAL